MDCDEHLIPLRAELSAITDQRDALFATFETQEFRDKAHEEQVAARDELQALNKRLQQLARDIHNHVCARS